MFLSLIPGILESWKLAITTDIPILLTEPIEYPRIHQGPRDFSVLHHFILYLVALGISFPA